LTLAAQEMRCFIDVDTQQTILLPGVSAPVTSFEFKRTATARLEVQFTQRGLVIELPSDAAGIFGVKDSGKYDETAFLSGSLGWVKTGTGAATVYSFTLSFINTALDALFNVDGNPNNDVAQLTLMGEIQWTTGGNTFKSPTLAIVIDNDVNRGGETMPSTPPISYGVFWPSITGLTGGGSTNVDGIPTINIQVGTIIEVLVTVSGTPQWWTFRLDAGAATLSPPAQIVPPDYNGTTNNKHWTGSAGQPGRGAGLKYTYSNDVANTDPTAGVLKFNSTTLASITNLRISNTDGDANALAALLSTWDASTSSVKGTLLITKDGAPSNFIALSISGARTDNSGWKNFPLTYVASGGAFANTDVLKVHFTRAGDAGSAGATGGTGPGGRDSGLKYNYSNDTANTDPTSGKLKFDSTTLASITNLRINNTDGDANALSALLATWDASTNAVRGTLLILKDGAPSNFIALSISGARTDNSGWKNFPLTYVASGGAFANSDVVKVIFVRAGDVGPTGATGQDGGFKYQFNTALSGDPGTGLFLFNNATFLSATQLNISETDANSNTLSSFLSTLDDSTSPNKCLVVAIKQGGSAYFSFYITGTLTDTGPYDIFPVTPVSTSGAISNNDIFHLLFVRVGDAGGVGATGATGQDGGFKYGFNTAIGGDPGSGAFQFSNATFLSATQFSISKTDGNANTLTGFLATQAGSTSPNKCLIVAIKQGGAGYFTFYITGALTDNGAYDTFPITPVSTSGVISNGDVFHLHFERVGDAGVFTPTAARVFNSVAIATVSAVFKILTFDSERRNDGSVHNTGFNISRLTAPIAGWYAITGHIVFASNATGLRDAAILLNGATIIAQTLFPAATTNVTNISIAAIYYLNAGDYVELEAYQDSGGALNVTAAGNYTPEFAMTAIGGPGPTGATGQAGSPGPGNVDIPFF
jgi:hypothetical protein